MCSQAGDGHGRQEPLAQSHGWKPRMSRFLSPWFRHNEPKNQNFPAAFHLALCGIHKPNVISVSKKKKKNLTLGSEQNNSALASAPLAKTSLCPRFRLFLMPRYPGNPSSLRTAGREGTPAVTRRPRSLAVPWGYPQSPREGKSHLLLQPGPAPNRPWQWGRTGARKLPALGAAGLSGFSLPYSSHTFSLFPLSLDFDGFTGEPRHPPGPLQQGRARLLLTFKHQSEAFPAPSSRL